MNNVPNLERTSIVQAAAHPAPAVTGLSGQALIDALQACPHPDVEIEPARSPMPVKDSPLLPESR
jgi:hypothetical protein